MDSPIVTGHQLLRCVMWQNVRNLCTPSAPRDSPALIAKSQHVSAPFKLERMKTVISGCIAQVCAARHAKLIRSD